MGRRDLEYESNHDPCRVPEEDYYYLDITAANVDNDSQPNARKEEEQIA